MYLFDMLPKTQFMLPPASTLGKRRLVVIWLHSNSEERKEERNRGRKEEVQREKWKLPPSFFFLIPPSLCHIPPFHLPYPSFHLLPILHSPYLPPHPPAIPTTWGDYLTPLRHISPVIIVSTNRESRLTSTGVVSILGGGGVWIVSVFGFEAILVASSCSSKILGRLK